MITLSRLRSTIEAKLTSNNLRSAWSASEVEQRKSVFVFRMPVAALFDELYEIVNEVCASLDVKHKRVGKWYTVEELDDVLGAVRWLWPKWIPSGFLTLLVGEPGGGKSMIALDWVRTVTLPGQWAMEQGLWSATPALSVWIETESSQQLLSIRCKSMGLVRTRILLPGFDGDLLGQPDMMDETHRERLTNMIHHNKPALVVLDSLGGAHTRGENRIEEVRPMLDFFARLARDEETAIVAIHHLRKRGVGEDIVVTMDRIRGSSAFSAFARSIIALEKQIDDTLMLRVIKSNVARTPASLVATTEFDKHDNPHCVNYSLHQPAVPKKTKKEKAAEWVYNYLLEHGKVRFSELVEVASGSEGYTKNNLYEVREIIGDALAITGDGRSAYWEILRNPIH